MKWISIKEKLPNNENCPNSYVIKHYNEVKEIARFDGEDWWVISPRFSQMDEKLSKEYWPSFWLEEEE